MEEERFTAEDAEGRREAPRENRAGDLIVAACLKVHTALGSRLLESAYEACLAHELIARGLRVNRQLLLPIQYDGITLDAGYRVDLLVDECVVIELKAIDAVLPVHVAQVMRDGIKRLVNGL